MHLRSDNRVFYLVLVRNHFLQRKKREIVCLIRCLAMQGNQTKEKKRKSNLLLLNRNIETKRVNRDIR